MDMGGTIMNINWIPATTSPSPVWSSKAASDPAPSTPASAEDPLASENVFLQLFVAQLKNQDPTSPADPSQFVTQLAQFTTLENSTQVKSDLDSILALMQANAGPGAANQTSNS
jgi:flagellar basal-body rod modification protein FlgD